MRTRACSTYRRVPTLVAVLGLVTGLLAVLQVAGAPSASAAYQVFPVTGTPEAGLGRIVTAPNGDMWFTMENANKIGRITPAGVITEFPVDEPDDVDGSIPDLGVAPDGTVWVIYDHGRGVLSFRPADQAVAGYTLGDYPYGEEIAFGPDGAPWISLEYDHSGVARITGGRVVESAQPCDGAIARGNDGTMWCQSDDRIIRLSADGSTGATYPLPEGLPDPNSLAAGPVGSMWFARYFPGTWISKPDSGDVGWIDQATGQTTIFPTGEDTAPFSLTRGPDNAMWFTSLGDAAGIGHLDARGRGALTKVGNYSPRYLTFSQAGDVWFTDSTNNAIVRVPRADLQVTNVDPGANSVFTVGGGGPLFGTVKGAGKPLVVKDGRVPVKIACPQGGASCQGRAVLQHAKKAKPLTKKASYAVKPGKSETVRLKLSKAGAKAIGRKATKARVTLSADGAKVSKTVKVRR